MSDHKTAVSGSTATPFTFHSRVEEGLGWRWSGQPDLRAVRLAAIGAREFLQRRGLTEEELSAWELVFTEALNNSVLHNVSRQEQPAIELEIFASPSHISARLTDHTAGFDWPTSTDLPDMEAESGRGLFLIDTLTDSRSYVRGNGTNTLTLSRRRLSEGTGEAADPALEQTLQAMTEELSACYESLSAIFRFSAELSRSEAMEPFAQRLLQQLVSVTNSDRGSLRMLSPEGGLATIAALGLPPGSPGDLFPLEAAALATRQDQWIEPPKSGADPSLARSGLVHPFFEGDTPMGLIRIERLHTDTPLRAGEMNIVHTFAEFFAQQVLRRRHEEAAVKASVAQRELELASNIQRSLLPRGFPAVKGLDMVGHCESALEVGGDFYDVMRWGRDGVFFVMADVMGKGVGASMMAAVTRTVFRSQTEHFGTPAKLMETAARQLHADFDNLEMFVTAVAGVVDVACGVVRFASAGHCPVITLSPDGHATCHEKGGLPLGLEDNPVYDEFEIPFPAGSNLVVFTDGLTDSRDGRGAFHSHNELAAWLASNPAADVHGLLDALLRRLRHRDSAATLADDQTFLLIGREPIH